MSLIELAVERGEKPRIEAHLRGIALRSPDVGALSAFYHDALGYVGELADGIWSGRLGARTLTLREGAANSIDCAIFAVSDEGQLKNLQERLVSADVPFDAVVAPDMEGSSLLFTDPDGNRLLFGVAAGVAEEEGASAGPTARLQHVVFATDQVPQMLQFYWEVVGFAPIDFVLEDAGDLTSVFLRCGDEHHSIAIFRAPRRRLDHFCYDVGDWSQIRDWADRFAARHIKLRWGPGRHGPGNNLFLFINDPDGNWLEFSAELERIADPRPAGQWVHEERTLNSWGSAILRS